MKWRIFSIQINRRIPPQRTAGVPVTLAESVCHTLAHLQSVAVS